MLANPSRQECPIWEAIQRSYLGQYCLYRKTFHFPGSGAAYGETIRRQENASLFGYLLSGLRIYKWSLYIAIKEWSLIEPEAVATYDFTG